ncbi:MAG: C-type lectin domain-containing protein [Myxococcota bacterium]|nr:C-type lectin domain-containing protein [Myxococcota bacterium]
MGLNVFFRTQTVLACLVLSAGCISSTDGGNGTKECAVRQAVRGTLVNSVSDIKLDNGTVRVDALHKIDIDEIEDGCITAVNITLSQSDGRGCTFELSYASSTDGQGGLTLQSALLSADSFCPGWSDADEGSYRLMQTESARISVGNRVPDRTADQSCFTTDFSLTGRAILASGTGRMVTIDFSQVVIEGNISSVGNTAAKCPNCVTPGPIADGCECPCGQLNGQCLVCANGIDNVMGQQGGASISDGSAPSTTEATNSSTMPNTPENQCDNQDDDGDGIIDEGLGVGEMCSSPQCGDGTIVCHPNLESRIICQPLRLASIEERCNLLDDDCDGLVDEGLSMNGAECSRVGGPRSDGAASNGMTSMERCDGVDNDGDAYVDEGIRIECVTPAGEPGFQICQGGSLSERCFSEGTTDETRCDGQDDDGDGKVDEGFTSPPVAEICDEQDNDCDGRIDEGLINACGTCGPAPAEQCNAMDDDCDGDVDEETECPCARDTFDGRSYLFCADRRYSWSNARRICQRLGYDLAIITDAREQEFLTDGLDRTGAGDAWIGLSDDAVEGTFVWIDGSPTRGYVNWSDDEPNDAGNEDCGVIQMQAAAQLGSWSDRDCNQPYDYVCESP